MASRDLEKQLLLRPEDEPASRDEFEAVGAFDSGGVRAHAKVMLLVRVAELPRERRRGSLAFRSGISRGRRRTGLLTRSWNSSTRDW